MKTSNCPAFLTRFRQGALHFITSWETEKNGTIKTFLSFAINSQKAVHMNHKSSLKTHRFFLGYTIPMVIFLAACSASSLYDRSVEIDESGWHEDTIALFDDVFISDTISPYNFYINLRHSDEYRYSNFYLFLNTTLPNGHLSRDTIELMLADNTGKWYGKGFGHIKDNRVLVRQSLVFPLKGNYKFTIEQAMREEDNVLEGVKSVGIRIDREYGKME